MKKVGIIGGMTWHSTIDYYKLINEYVEKTLGGNHSAEMIIYNLDFDVIAKAQHSGDWDKTADILSKAGISLKSAGAEALVIATNTMHKVAGAVSEESGLPIYHIVDAVAEEMKGRGFKTAGLIGTRFTMEDPFYKTRLEEKHGLKTIVPKEAGREAIHSIIYNELAHGELKEESLNTCLEITNSLHQAGADCVILGCTELPLLIKQEDTPVPIINTTKVHSLYIAQKMLQCY